MITFNYVSQNLSLYFLSINFQLEYTIAQQTNEIRTLKDKLSSHDAAARRTVATLQNELKVRVDQVHTQVLKLDGPCNKISLLVLMFDGPCKKYSCFYLWGGGGLDKNMHVLVQFDNFLIGCFSLLY